MLPKRHSIDALVNLSKVLKKNENIQLKSWIKQTMHFVVFNSKIDQQKPLL